ncbi:hypothetical protein BDP27DRAFT_1371192 [Rhodocollybia butyracea]|uniref:Uncharacterized protein n=1 Tax=Rhodocollybia butyracea TaxID=206335 RepID=A0A9P5P9F9_9AGAR|nr:hypothetical protein BDP27DRAFT_1371192 [Rhodocollybia butyracea]
MASRMCFGFLIPDKHMQSVGKMYYEKLFPNDELPEERWAHATYGAVASTALMEKVDELPWALSRMATVFSTCNGHIGRVVSLFDNFSHQFGQLGSPGRPGPKQLTVEIVKQFQEVLEIQTLPCWYYMADQSSDERHIDISIDGGLQEYWTPTAHAYVTSWAPRLELLSTWVLAAFREGSGEMLQKTEGYRYTSKNLPKFDVPLAHLRSSLASEA